MSPIYSSEHDAVLFIIERSLDLEGGNADPLGIGGGHTYYTFRVSNRTVARDSKAMIAVEGSGTTIAKAVAAFQERAKEIHQSIADKAAAKSRFLSKMAGEEL